MLRYRGPRAALAQVQELDAFPKIPESYSETSVQGGAISICTFVLILILVVSELRFFFDSRLKFKYEVDVEFNEKVWLNFDITVATECRWIGADVVDVTGQAWLFNQEIVEEPVTFELSPEEAAMRLSLLRAKEILLNHPDGTKLSEVAIKQGFNATAFYFQRQPVGTFNNGNLDSCRFYGNLLVNKVSGNFHIMAGKSVQLRSGHAHLSFITDSVKYNYSHRINHFSFGDMKVGFINTLDGDEHLTDFQKSIYHYYINAVSTHINSRRLKTHTYQFSVSEQARTVEHTFGSNGMPGIFFKYNFSPLAVTIDEKVMPLGRLFVRLCGIIGGVFATSAVVNLLAGLLLNYVKSFSTIKKDCKKENSKQMTSLLSKPVLQNKPALQ